MGAFVLTQFNYKGFDFNTHKKGEAIVVSFWNRCSDSSALPGCRLTVKYETLTSSSDVLVAWSTE